MNDNGQTGRKLVMDFYGPHVAIGGGALPGKDPWRLDRPGAMRARQIAVAIVETGFVREARVTFVGGPRDERPSGVELEAVGRVMKSLSDSKHSRHPGLAKQSTTCFGGGGLDHEVYGLQHVVRASQVLCGLKRVIAIGVQSVADIRYELLRQGWRQAE